jgi:hypothetical protein
MRVAPQTAMPSALPTVHATHGTLRQTCTLHVHRRSGPDASTKATVQKLPMLSVKAGPRDGDDWIKRMKVRRRCTAAAFFVALT